ncbi:DUF4270 family protein [Fabibacter sp. E12]|nr:DUF4270 family protein [Roseivirga sp. E12]
MGLIIFNSCEEKGDFELGSDVAPIEFEAENISLSTGIVWLDSINSANLARIFVGEHSGSDFGDMTAKGYLGLDLNENSHPVLTADDVLDSVKLNFSINFLYDTSATNRALNLRAYKIGESFPADRYITTSELIQTNELIASGDVQIDTFDSVYSIDADLNWAQEIFDGIRDENATFDAQPAFSQFFPGFVFRHEGSSQNIFGLGTGSNFEVIFYYSAPLSDGSGNVANRTITMSGVGQPSFHHFTSDRSATNFAFVQETSVEYNQISELVVQSGIGLVTKLDLSDLERFANVNDGAIVNLAEMTVGPIGELPPGISPPSILLLLITDERNTLISDGGALRAIQEDGVSVISQAFPLQLRYNENDRTYTASVTSYVRGYLNDVFRRNEVFIYPANMNLSTNGFTLGLGDLEIKIFFSQLR